MTQRFDDSSDERSPELSAAAAELASPARRKMAIGLASLPFAMMARPAFAAAPPTSQVNTTRMAVTDTTVTVGQLHSSTGTMAISETGSIRAERLAIDQINAMGGILGRQLKGIQQDGAS